MFAFRARLDAIEEIRFVHSSNLALWDHIGRGAQYFRDARTASQSIKWCLYKLAAKQTRIGEIEAADERKAIEKAADRFKTEPKKLIAVSQATESALSPQIPSRVRR